MARNRRWRDMATKMGIDIVTDEEIERKRKERALAVAHADFLGD